MLVLPLLLAAACANGPSEADIGPAAGPTVASPAPDSVAVAYAYLEAEKADLGLSDPRRQLAVRGTSDDALGATHVRFDQVVDGVPVWGGDMAVHIDREGEVYRVTGRAVTGLEGLGTTPAIDPEAARRAALAGRTGARAEGPTLAVLPEGGTGRLVYRVTVYEGLVRTFVFVDAATAGVVREVSGSPTAGGPM